MAAENVNLVTRAASFYASHCNSDLYWCKYGIAIAAVQFQIPSYNQFTILIPNLRQYFKLPFCPSIHHQRPVMSQTLSNQMMLVMKVVRYASPMVLSSFAAPEDLECTRAVGTLHF